MSRSLFFRIFPPPKFMVMNHAGLHISDDSVQFLEYGVNHRGHRIIARYGQAELPAGIMDGGDIKDEKAFKDFMREFDKKFDLSFVKVSVPEEKAYLFQTDIPGREKRIIAQNIEFKLEENVPLSAPDAIFYFDLLPTTITAGSLRASVSVVSRVYIEHYIELLREAGIQPISFEVIPKAIARAIIPAQESGAQLILYIMNKKTGIYVVTGGVVCFTSTISWSYGLAGSSDLGSLVKEINKVISYWSTHYPAASAIKSILLVGKPAPQVEDPLKSAIQELDIKVTTADAWHNIFDLDSYVPPIHKEESLDYAAAAGLAMISN